ncbi:MAG: hypothetical protein FWF57_00550 [Defluviitaleaceae bacterium]|nr:hypothetical protein [Defluviitaleaceae bacterium]
MYHYTNYSHTVDDLISQSNLIIRGKIISSNNETITFGDTVIIDVDYILHEVLVLDTFYGTILKNETIFVIQHLEERQYNHSVRNRRNLRLRRKIKNTPLNIHDDLILFLTYPRESYSMIGTDNLFVVTFQGSFYNRLVSTDTENSIFLKIDDLN